MKCAVGKCKQNSGKRNKSLVSFYKFPKNEVERKQWITFCNREKPLNVNSEKMCGSHFKPDDFERNLQFEMGFMKRRTLKLKPGAVPSIPSIIESEEAIGSVEEECFNDNIDVQTDSVMTGIKNDEKNIKTLEMEIDALRQENAKLTAAFKQSNITIKYLSCQIQKLRCENVNLVKSMKSLFTQGQIKKLKNGDKRQTFKTADIAQSITLYSSSAKAYRLLRKKHFPLPSVRTLQRWSEKLDMSTGILKPVLKVLSATKDMSENDKLCVLSFDEMKAKKKYCYDKTTDSTLAPANYIQVAMLRGLISNWKQPIYYEYDCQMSKNILFHILMTMQQYGFTIVAIVSDLGGGNRKLFNELEVNYLKPWFSFERNKIFVFNDVPHLIKLLRNHFIDSGFIISNKEVKTNIILNLLSISSNDLKITHKISTQNLCVVGAERQKVKLATKLFSHTVAQSITRAASLGYLSNENWSECAELFKLTNDWFDVLNSRVPRQDTRERCHAYGLALETQNDILMKMSQMISEFRVIGKNTLLPFQKGIIQSNNALQMLYKELKDRYNVEYILTYRLNQDVLENFFGMIRAKGGLHDHPDRQEFKYRLRSYILGYNEGVLSDNANVEVDNTPDLNISLTGNIFKSIQPTSNIPQNEGPHDDLENLQYDGLENLAGYICHKLKKENPNLSSHLNDGSYTWVDHLSEGGLSKPSGELMATLLSCDTIFSKLNEDKLLLCSKYLETHLLEAKDVQGSEDAKKLFFRCRMYFRIRQLNAQIVQNSNNYKRKLNKIMK